MAPFRRGTSRRGSGYHVRGRSQFRGGGQGRGRERERGRGIGRGRAPLSANRKNTFLSTRVEELGKKHSDGSSDEEHHRDEEGAIGFHDEPSSGEESDVPVVSAKPYNALLQSLNAQNQTKERPNKRRRISVDKATTATQQTVDESWDVVPLITKENEDLDVKSNSAGSVALAEVEHLDDEPEDNDDAAADTFGQHFQNPEEDSLAMRIESLKSARWSNQKDVLQGNWKAISFRPVGSRELCKSDTALRYDVQQLQASISSSATRLS